MSSQNFYLINKKTKNIWKIKIIYLHLKVLKRLFIFSPVNNLYNLFNIYDLYPTPDKWLFNPRQ